MFGNLSGPTLLVILFIVLLLFGAPKLPGLAKSLGQSMKILKKEVSSSGDDSTTPPAAAPQAPAAPQQPSAPQPPQNVTPPEGTGTNGAAEHQHPGADEGMTHGGDTAPRA